MTISFTMEFKLIRKNEGQYDEHGRYIDGTKTETIVKGCVQPACEGELLNLPEGQRIQGAVKIYTDTELVIGDRVEYKGMEYEVHLVEDRTGLFLPHYKSIAAKVPENEEMRKVV